MWAWALQYSCFTEIELLDTVLGSWNPGWGLARPLRLSVLPCAQLWWMDYAKGNNGRFPPPLSSMHSKLGQSSPACPGAQSRHGWWVQRGTFLASQHWEFGQGEEKYLAIFLPASGFQPWLLSYKAGAKLVSLEVVPSEPMTSWSRSHVIFMCTWITSLQLRLLEGFLLINTWDTFNLL